MRANATMLVMAAALGAAALVAARDAVAAEGVLRSATMYLVAAAMVLLGAGALYAALGGVEADAARAERERRIRAARQQDRRTRTRTTNPSPGLQQRGASSRRRDGFSPRERAE